MSGTVALDVMRPFPESAVGYQFVLVIMDYATRYPEAVPIGTVTTQWVLEELIKWIARVEIPHEILIDQGMNFMSSVLKGVCETLKIWQLHNQFIIHKETALWRGLTAL